MLHIQNPDIIKMGGQAFCTEHTLDRKSDKGRLKFNETFVISITDEEAFSSAGALAPMGLKII